MINKVLITLCEGPHDVAFIYRILKTKGFVHFSKSIKDFPFPLNQYLQNEVLSTNVQELKLEEVNRRLLPNEVLVQDESLILLYAIGGDSKLEIRSRLLKAILDIAITPEDEHSFTIESSLSYSFLYFYDSDNKGIQNRLAEISAEISNIIKVDNGILFENNGDYYTYRNIKYGAYIFANSNTTNGKLEDVLMPLLRKDNEAVFKYAEFFLKLHDPSRINRLEIAKTSSGEFIERRGTKKGNYDKDKSIIGIVGQLQNSGSTNTVCIKHSDYLTLSKIKESESCNIIYGVFENLI